MKIYEEFDKNMKNALVDFLESTSENVIEALSPYIDSLEKVPGLNYIFPLIKLVNTWRDERFIHQIKVFYEELNKGSISKIEKDKFLLEKYTTDNQRNRIIEIILTFIDSNNNSQKIPYLAKIFEKYIKEIINTYEFEMLTEAYGDINEYDLKVLNFLLKYKGEGIKINQIDLERNIKDVYVSGICKKLESLSLVRIDSTTWSSISEIQMADIKLTELGEKLFECISE